MRTACSSLDLLANRPLGRGPALKRLFARISDTSNLSIGASRSCDCHEVPPAAWKNFRN